MRENLTYGLMREASAASTLPLQNWLTGTNLNGVWNLVLACQQCNRGVGGKFDQIPESRFLQRLHHRNNFFIESHHPLRETLINQTGVTEKKRSQFLLHLYNTVAEIKPIFWHPQIELEPHF